MRLVLLLPALLACAPEEATIPAPPAADCASALADNALSPDATPVFTEDFGRWNGLGDVCADGKPVVVYGDLTISGDQPELERLRCVQAVSGRLDLSGDLPPIPELLPDLRLAGTVAIWDYPITSLAGLERVFSRSSALHVSGDSSLTDVGALACAPDVAVDLGPGAGRVRRVDLSSAVSGSFRMEDERGVEHIAASAQTRGLDIDVRFAPGLLDILVPEGGVAGQVWVRSAPQLQAVDVAAQGLWLEDTHALQWVEVTLDPPPGVFSTLMISGAGNLRRLSLTLRAPESSLVLDGVESLEAIDGGADGTWYDEVYLSRTGLHDLGFLANVTRIEGSLVLMENEALADVSALGRLESIGGDVWVEGNDVTAAEVRQVLAGVDIAGTVTIE